MHMKKMINALLCGLLFSGCSSDLAGESSSAGGIAGSVSDRTTGEPVATVNVTLSPGGRSTVTGSDGNFTFADLEPGEYTFDIRKEGYTPAADRVAVEAGRMTAAHLLIERIPSKITTDRDLLDYGDSYSVNSLSFNIVNSSYEDLEWEISHSCAWIAEVKPSAGTLAYGKTGTIVVVIDRELLAAGLNETYVVVTTKNGSGSVEVKLSAEGADRHLPKLNMLDPSGVTASSARFNAEMTDTGFPEYTERGFVYAAEPMPTVDTSIERISVSVTSEMTFSASVGGLTLGQEYYVRAYAVNDVGVAYSANSVKFATTAVPAAVEMMQVSNVDIANGTAIFYGNIAAVGDPAYSEKGFVYSTSTAVPTIFDTKAAVAGGNAGIFDARVGELQVNRLYYVRAYAINEAGVAYSTAVATFSTDEVLPEVRTDAATDEDRENSSVVLHGTIVSSGEPPYVERGFVYSSLYESPTIYDGKIIVAGSGDTSFEYRSTELSSASSYYVRAYAANSKGTAYGETIRIFVKDVVELPQSGLMVQPSDAGFVNWNSAGSMCRNSTHEGYTDWRLPTKDELMALYTNRERVGGFVLDWYWSSTLESYAYYYKISFGSGAISAGYLNSSCYVRCVRTMTE